jgi:hypothetical protein
MSMPPVTSDWSVVPMIVTMPPLRRSCTMSSRVIMVGATAFTRVAWRSTARAWARVISGRLRDSRHSASSMNQPRRSM